MKQRSPFKTALLAALFLGLMVPGAVSTHDGPLVTDVVNDVFDEVELEQMTFQGGCGGGEFETLPSGKGFRFFEIPESSRPISEAIENNTGTDAPDSPTGGYESTGCGTATYPVVVPRGIDHLHVRFNATRTVDVSEAREPSGFNAEQSLKLRTRDGTDIGNRAYFEPDAPSSERVFIDPPSFDPPTPREVQLDWYFEEEAAGNDDDVPNSASGLSYEATVENPVIEYSHLPADNFTQEEVTRQEKAEVLIESTVVSTLSQETVDRFDAINVRVRTQGNPGLAHVVLPDGTVIDQTVTRTDSGPGGYDPDAVLVEHFADSSWFTISHGIVAGQGAGDYTFVIHESQGLTVSAGLIPLAAAITLLPLVASAFAVYGTMRFRREAFGGFQRAAFWLTIAIGVLLAYYIAVVLSAIVTGSFQRMVILPFDAVAWLLYLQVSLAAVGFLVVFVVGRELYRITVPRRSS